ncbi:TMV resistance protein N-like [Bidens hawaiensis]|uniref:TMV resistance protein N-like n=1 Tax=Bidens hawaiensis TaxID=980011 RepID=UPI00404B5679
MASSSSSSQIIPAFVSQSWNHEVFLSFRGEDTRKGFVDNLYEALVQQGIQTYKDDETLVRGESIGLALRKAIQESRIAVIVFSKNYADSSWCLDELSCIIECKEKRGQIVMPIFYDVDPSDVRKQNRKYEEAFIKHESDHKHKIESWKKALVDASNLSGWVLKDFANGHEAKCIKDIVATISSRLYPLIKNGNNDLIGIETRLQELKSMLEIGSHGVLMIGIWGVGGGGKTTLASAAYMDISHQFEASYLLENIREESSKHGLKRLQEKVLSRVSIYEERVESVIEGKTMIKRRLCHKRVLVVLDDVDDLKQLEALAGSHDWFGEGSRIIITTRDKHLLTRHTDKIYAVSLLSHDEAITLFNRHAYRNDKPVEDYERLSQEAVSYAGGLPLALEIIGSFLYDKDKDEWVSALAKLKHIPNVKVMERLKISYDGLENDEKELFLDIACFFRRWEIDRAMRVLEVCSFHPVIGVKVLKQKSLIKVSNGRFDMHDLVEEMAHYIVKGEHPNSPEKHSRIWQERDIVEFCYVNTETLLENNHIEVLALPSYVSHPSLPHFGSIKDNYFRLQKLRNYPLPSYVSHPHLPYVVASMKKLRWIYWEGFPASSFPTNFHPTKLGCLILIRGQQTQLWKGRKNLPNLKILDLRCSFLLTTTPNFHGLSCLETLILEDCIQLKEIHPSIGYHKRLVSVNMRGCKVLKTFPPIIYMKKLETLELSYCHRLHKFPDIQTNMDSLVNLHLERTDIEIIPPSVGQFCTNLITFDLRNCEMLRRIEGNFRLLKRLKFLKLEGCDQLEKFAGDFFDGECCLEELSLAITRQKSTSSKNLINRIYLQCFYQNTLASPKLPQFPRFIRKLSLRCCSLGDGDIPSDMSGLLNLQILDLSFNNFTRLHSSLSQIPCLKFLALSNCNNLLELPDLPSSITILKANHCHSLQRLGDLSNYKWLWMVLLRGCRNNLAGSQRVPHSMLQRKDVEDRFLAVTLPSPELRSPTIGDSDTTTLIALQLPHNRYSDFSGILLRGVEWHSWVCRIVIKQEISMESQPHHDHWEEFDRNPESNEDTCVCYVPFSLLRHIPWLNPTCTINISLEIDGMCNPKVGLVPRKSKLGDPKDCLESWEEYTSSWEFKITNDWKSSKITIKWCQH